MTDPRGGKREGAGRKPDTPDQLEVKRIQRALNKCRRKYGVGWQERLVEMGYNAKPSIAFPALKLIAELVVGKSSRQDVTATVSKEVGPLIIPELYEREEEEEVVTETTH